MNSSKLQRVSSVRVVPYLFRLVGINIWHFYDFIPIIIRQQQIFEGNHYENLVDLEMPVTFLTVVIMLDVK